jgi:hypothetical protein
MSKANYIHAVEPALREDVLPATTDSVACDSLASCVNILLALRSALDLSPASDVPSFDTDALPPSLRAAFRGEGVSAVDLPVGLADDLSVRRHTVSTLAAGKAWVEASDGGRMQPGRSRQTALFSQSGADELPTDWSFSATLPSIRAYLASRYKHRSWPRPMLLVCWCRSPGSSSYRAIRWAHHRDWLIDESATLGK